VTHHADLNLRPFSEEFFIDTLEMPSHEQPYARRHATALRVR
jgi:hypothetical protein